MAGLKLGVVTCILCVLITAAKPKSYHSEKPQSDAVTASWFRMFNAKFRLLERKIDLDFKILGQTLREELKGGTGGHYPDNTGYDELSQRISQLKFEIQTLQIDMKQMAANQLQFEERFMLALDNSTASLQDNFEDVSEVLGTVSANVGNLNHSIQVLSNKLDDLANQGRETTPAPTPSKTLC